MADTDARQSTTLYFSHPLIQNDLQVTTGANNINWDYQLNTVIIPTIAGSVEQILSVKAGQLQISGTCRNYNDYRAIVEWFRRYMTIAGLNGHDEHGVTFSYPHRGWKFPIHVINAPYRVDPLHTPAPEWQIVAELIRETDQHMHEVEKWTLNSFTASLDSKVYVPNLYIRDNIYSDPYATGSVDKLNSESIASNLGNQFQRLVGSWAAGDFSMFDSDMTQKALDGNLSNDDGFFQIFGTDRLDGQTSQSATSPVGVGGGQGSPTNAGSASGAIGSISGGTNKYDQFFVKWGNYIEAQAPKTFPPGTGGNLLKAIAFQESTITLDAGNGAGQSFTGIMQTDGGAQKYPHDPDGQIGAGAKELVSKVSEVGSLGSNALVAVSAYFAFYRSSLATLSTDTPIFGPLSAQISQTVPPANVISPFDYAKSVFGHYDTLARSAQAQVTAPTSGNVPVSGNEQAILTKLNEYIRNGRLSLTHTNDRTAITSGTGAENSEVDGHHVTIDIKVYQLLEFLLDNNIFNSIIVTCVVGGHSQSVAGSSNQSRHWTGHAMDIGSLNGTIIDATSSSGVAFQRAQMLKIGALASQFGIQQVIGFTDLNSGVYLRLSDHKDHIHVGF